MICQILLISKVELLRMFEINKTLHSNEQKRKKKTVLLAVVIVYVAALIVLYMGLITSSLIDAGISQIVFSYLCAVSSLVILFFTVFKTGDTIFNIREYEKTIVLPVTPSSIILARFLVMYTVNLAFTVLIILPGAVIYALKLGQGISYWLLLIAGVIFVPIIPVAVATLIGALIYSAASRMKHKNAVTIVLSLVFVIALMVFPIFITQVDKSEINIARIAEYLGNRINAIYPPAKLFSSAVADRSAVSLLIFAILSYLAAFIPVAIIAGFYSKICSALFSKTTCTNFDFSGNLHSKSVLRTLFYKDLKRYFASSVYVINTTTGYLLTLITAIAVAVMGNTRIDALIGETGVTEKYLAIVITLLCVISPLTTCSISIEGKQWWIMQSSPLGARVILQSKLLCGLAVSITPTFVALLIVMLFVTMTDALSYVTMLITPVTYTVFINLVGLSFNLRSPMFDWDNETVPVKQSMPVLFTMLIGFLSVAIPAGIIFIFPGICQNIVLLIFSGTVCIASVPLWHRISQINLCKISE